jgi:hypothetical protein
MKSTKSILLLVAGVMLTVALFSFKNSEGSKKEYIHFVIAAKASINYPDGTEEEFPIRGNFYKQGNKIINDLAEKGWEVIELTVTTNGIVTYILERTKN